MSTRTTIGTKAESALGKERTDRLRQTERRYRKALASRIAPAGTVVQKAKRAGKPGNPVQSFFFDNDGRLIHKWHHYLDVYHDHFARFRDKEITVVEFGVFHGGSLQMWKKYFGPKARIVGVDINPMCLQLAEDNIEIYIGDQEDRDFLRDLAAKVGPVDVLIEDGGHYMGQQIATFEEFWPHIKNGGVYLVEDLHTSYRESHGGGYRRPGTYMEYAKNLLDQVNAYHSQEPEFAVDEYTKTVKAMHVYDSVIVFDKARVPKPTQSKTGTPSF